MSDSGSSLIEIGSHIPDGTSESGHTCPECRGGPNAERSFSITRDGAYLLFLCHRASCGYKGRVLSINGQAGIILSGSSVQPSPGRIRSFDGETVSLAAAPEQEQIREYLNEVYLNEDEIKRGQLSWTASHSASGKGRVVYPTFTRLGNRSGCILRAINRDDKPKTLTYIAEGRTKLAWYTRNEPTRTLIIVEDTASALRASTYLDSVALLGTDLSIEKMLDIAKHSAVKKLLALDADATDKAVAMARKASIFVPGLMVLELPKDLKNMNRTELEEFLK